MPHKTLPWVRRTLQIFIILILFISPLFQLIRTFRQDPYPYPTSPAVTTQWSRDFLIQFDHWLRSSLDPIYENVSGGPYTFKFFPVIFTEPLTITVQAVNSVLEPASWNWVFLTTLLIALGLALLFGRAFCGYICPMSLIVSTNLKIQRKFFGRKIKAQAPPGTMFKKKGRVVYMIVLFLLVITNPLVLQYLLPPAIFQHSVSDFLLWGGWTLWGALFLGLVVFELSKPGYFCRYLCPTGIFLSVVGKLKVFRLRHDSDLSCPKGCMQCMEECWLGLSPMARINDPRCDMCSRCLDHCPTGRIKFISVALVSLLLLLPAESSMADSWSDKEDYHNIVLEKTFFEGESTTKDRSGKELNVFYSVFGRAAYENKPGDLSLYVHIKDGDKIYTKPLTLIQWREGKELHREEYETVTHPISIINRSTYGMDFNYEPRTHYEFFIESPAGDFDPLSFKFYYPDPRF